MNVAQAISAVLMLVVAAGGAWVANQFFGLAIALIWSFMMLVTWIVVQVLVGGGGSSSGSTGTHRQSKGARQGRD